MRITRKHVEAKVGIVNRMLDFGDDVAYSTVGAIYLYSAYDAWTVHRWANESGGASDLASLGTLRETARFLDGMIQALRIVEERDAESGR